MKWNKLTAVSLSQKHHHLGQEFSSGLGLPTTHDFLVWSSLDQDRFISYDGYLSNYYINTMQTSIHKCFTTTVNFNIVDMIA